MPLAGARGHARAPSRRHTATDDDRGVFLSACALIARAGWPTTSRAPFPSSWPITRTSSTASPCVRRSGRPTPRTRPGGLHAGLSGARSATTRSASASCVPRGWLAAIVGNLARNRARRTTPATAGLDAVAEARADERAAARARGGAARGGSGLARAARCPAQPLPAGSGAASRQRPLLPGAGRGPGSAPGHGQVGRPPRRAAAARGADARRCADDSHEVAR